MTPERAIPLEISVEELDAVKFFASCSDEVFAREATLLVPVLPSQLRQETLSLLNSAVSVANPKFKDLIYIPVVHGQGSKFSGEIIRILNDLPKGDTLIICAESDVQDYRKSAINNSRSKDLRRLEKLGLSPAVKKPTKGIELYEEDIVDLCYRNSSFKAVGADGSPIMPAVMLSLEFLGMVSPELLPRLSAGLAVEARTRYALQRTSQLAEDQRQIVFIQGFVHGIGIQEWCKRHSVNFDLRVPTPLKPAIESLLTK